jgi:hypothetical protein
MQSFFAPTEPPPCRIPQKPIHKMKWTEAEDALLLQWIEVHGTMNWTLVASHIPGRTGKQCRERWKNGFDPNLNHKTWTPDEDAILLSEQAHSGTQWAKIASFLPNRSQNAVKNRWYWLKRQQGKGGRQIDRRQLTKGGRSDAPALTRSEEWVCGTRGVGNSTWPWNLPEPAESEW